MKHALLKFNHGVEIGARLAYLGHYKVTGDTKILAIANEELEHRKTVKRILETLGHKPFWGFDMFFTLVGNTIQYLCYISPKFALNWVASIMEVFAVFNYTKLARIYPRFDITFKDMAEAEKLHEDYFKQ